MRMRLAVPMKLALVGALAVALCSFALVPVAAAGPVDDLLGGEDPWCRPSCAPLPLVDDGPDPEPCRPSCPQ